MDYLARKFTNDTSVSLVCKKIKNTDVIEMCYFNKTDCKSIAPKLDPWKFVFGDYVFELDSVTQLRDDKQKGMKFCSIMLRGSKDSSTKKSKNRFLMGNVFLKNFYSVYDYDS